MRKVYEVKVYHRRVLFDKNLNLVYRWYLESIIYFVSLAEATGYFRAHNIYYGEDIKAILRYKKPKGGFARVKR